MAEPLETTIDQFVPDEVESAAYEVLSPLLPEMLIYYSGQNKKFSPPYATLRILSRQEIGNPTFGKVGDDGIQIMHQVIQGTLSLKVFGGAARRHLDNVRLRTKKPTSRDIMTRERFIIYATENVMDLENIRENSYYEPSAILDMAFRYTSRFSDNVGLIEHVKADGTINDLPVSFEIDILTPGA